jgi:hypothetical protein
MSVIPVSDIYKDNFDRVEVQRTTPMPLMLQFHIENEHGILQSNILDLQKEDSGLIPVKRKREIEESHWILFRFIAIQNTAQPRHLEPHSVVCDLKSDKN